jgi:putative inorganic carbon (hco3(-)) transporter
MERLAFSGSARAVDDPFRRAPSPRKPRLGTASSTTSPTTADPRALALEEQDVLAFRGLLAFTFVLFVRPQDSLPLLDAMHLGDITALFSLVALVVARVRRGLPPVTVSRELGWVAGFGAVMLLTAPLAIWPGGAVSVFIDLYSKVILIFALMVHTITTRARFNRLLSLVVAGTAYIAIRAVIDYGRGVNLIEDGRVTGAVGGLFGNPNDLALNMVAFLPLGLALMQDRGAGPTVRLAALIGAPAMALAIIFSKSRGGAIGLAGMLLVFLYQMRRIRPGVTAAVVVVCIATIPVLPSSFTARMASVFDSEQDTTGSREARKQLLREAAGAFKQNPLFGIGAGQFVNYNPDGRQEAWRETHNTFLQVAAELGLVGLFVFLAILYSGFAATRQTWRQLRGRGLGARARAPIFWNGSAPHLYSAALLASLSGWLLAAIFGSVAYYWTLYIILALAVTHRDITARDVQVTGAHHRDGRALRIA